MSNSSNTVNQIIPSIESPIELAKYIATYQSPENKKKQKGEVFTPDE